jgi:LPXTG-motif cell wall-anchored protein
MGHSMIRLATACAAVVLAAGLPTAPALAGQGSGDPRLAVSNATLPADRVSTVTVTGAGYLVPPHAPGVDVFGGVYLFFGWVADPDRFGPSVRNSDNNDGTFGVTYAYPGGGGDAGTRDDGSGTMRLISFTAGGESGAATGFHMDEDGDWSTTLRIFGSTFTSEGRSYDCQDVQCGVFTIGAHGKASATNEKFTPITFTGTPPAGGAPGGSQPGDSGGQDDPAAGGPGGTGDPGEPTSDPAAPTSAAPGADPAAAGDLASGGGGDGPLDATATSSRSTGGDPVPLLVAAALIAILAGALWWWRRRRVRPLNGPIDSISSGGTDI